MGDGQAFRMGGKSVWTSVPVYVPMLPGLSALGKRGCVDGAKQEVTPTQLSYPRLFLGGWEVVKSRQ